MAAASISALMTSIKTAKELAQSMVTVRDIAVFQGHLVDLRGEIINAQDEAFSAQEERGKLLDRIKKLETDIAALKVWEAEKQRYELRDVREAKGVFIYALKPELANGEPEHKICATCFQRGRKSILQSETRSSGRASVLICHECGTDLYIGGLRDAAHPAPRLRGPS
ncbi:MAG: hypothetical protein ACRYG8_22270 [Janthinobacterium lividum]